ncbi:MAG TPA: hypothetical protein VJ982_04515 [Gemmatimonadota bacterium]|nr:hypothetical protein [Gemmatimonadota bacterium]
MIHRFQWMAGVLALFAFAGPLAAQDPAENAPVTEPPSAQEPAMEQPAAQDPAAMDQAPADQAPAAHDWEFALAPTEKAPGASATVMVVDGETGSDFTIVATGLPAVDDLDAENQDVSTYTVWVVPGKDKVNESELAGVLTISPEGEGRLEAETDLESFGVIVTATPDGAPTQISGVPVLTGIPVQADAPPEAVEEAAEGAQDVAEEAAEVDQAAPEDRAEEAAEVGEQMGEEMEDVADEAQDAQDPDPDLLDAAADAAGDVADEVAEEAGEVVEEEPQSTP